MDVGWHVAVVEMGEWYYKCMRVSVFTKIIILLNRLMGEFFVDNP